MSYKIKSLVYFICFFASTVMYYGMDHDIPSEVVSKTMELAEVDMSNLSSDKVNELEDLK